MWELLLFVIAEGSSPSSSLHPLKTLGTLRADSPAAEVCREIVDKIPRLDCKVEEKKKTK